MIQKITFREIWSNSDFKLTEKPNAAKSRKGKNVSKKTQAACAGLQGLPSTTQNVFM